MVMRKPSVYNLTLAFFLLVILAFCFFYFITFRNLQYTISESKSDSVNLVIMKNLESLLDDMQDLETDQRGFIITGNKRYISGLPKEIAEHTEHLNNLRSVKAGDTTWQHKVSALSDVVERKVDFVKSQVKLIESGEKDEAIRNTHSGVGYELMISIRTNIKALEDEGRVQLNESTRKKQLSADRTKTFFTLLGGFILGLFLIFYFRIRNDLRKRLDTEKKLSMFNAELNMQVKEKTEELTSVFNRVSDGFLAMDSQLIFVYSNRMAEKMFDFPQGYFLGKSIWELFPSAKGNIFGESLTGAIKSQQSVHLEHFSEALQRWFESHIYPSESGVSIYFRDITEKRKSEMKFRQMLEAAPDGIIIINDKRKIMLVNNRVKELFGYDKDELIDQPIEMLIPEASRPKHEKHHNTYFDNPQVREMGVGLELFALKKDGSTFPVEISLSPITSEEGILVAASVREITERTKAEQQIRRERDLSDKLIDSLPGVFYFYDDKGKFIRWNRQFEVVTGYSGKEISEMHPSDFFEGAEKDYIIERISKVFTEGTSDAEAHFISKDNKRIPYYFKATSMMYEGKLCLLGTGIDITERKLAEKQVMETAEQLRELTAHLQSVQEEERTTIAREIHDELGQQLTVLKMDIAWLNKKIKTDDTVVNEKFSEALSSVDETIRSVRRIATSLRPSLLDDLGLTAAIEWQVQEFEKRTGIIISFIDNLTPSVPAKSISIEIFRILQESLTNIARHAKAQHVKIILEKEEDKLLFSVQDDGAGFDEQAVKEKKTLGLIGIKERVLLLGGNCIIESLPKKGTTVRVVIPFNE